jgi:hypothetical protein
VAWVVASLAEHPAQFRDGYTIVRLPTLACPSRSSIGAVDVLVRTKKSGS